MFAPPGVELCELRQHIAAEGLSAEAGLHGHDQHEVNVGQEVAHRLGGGVGIEDDAVEAAEGADLREQGAMVEARFDVEADQLCAGGCEGFGVALGFVEHEVHVEEKTGDLAAEFGDHLRAEGEVGHKVPVHDVEMQPGRPSSRYLRGAFGEAGVLAGEKRRSEDGVMRHERKFG